jgi:hypothetical protein
MGVGLNISFFLVQHEGDSFKEIGLDRKDNIKVDLKD